jgi:glycogen debranching enzyme
MRITRLDLDRARKLEWLETNGLGGYASSTVCGMNTRRYHGLLVAALKPPVGRMVLLSKIEETVIADGERYELGVNQYPGAVHPRGDRWLEEFRLAPFPVFLYRVAGREIEKRVYMARGSNTVVVEYELRGAPCGLELRPLIAFRDYHATMRRNDALDSRLEIGDGVVGVRPYEGCPGLRFAHGGGEVGHSEDWYFDFEYERERERGLDYREDLFQPFVLRYRLSGEVRVVVSTDAKPQAPRREKGCGPQGLVERLKAASDAYLVKRGEGHTVIAGYHWFADWGRDTMIALPGLTLAAGRFQEARGILREFARSVDQGMLPNRFPDAGETPEYNTVDATLWFFEAARAYAEASGDWAFVREELLPVFEDIAAWHVRGTRYGIRVDEDGLLACGEPGVQLTWMDAKVGDWVVTPRHGKPVEIQALWYNALRILESLGGGGRYGEMAGKARESFEAQFWNKDAGCLFDVVDGPARDGSIRPNQLFAVSLAYPLLEGGRARMVVDRVERELLTPMGPRSLSPHDPRYRGRYEGGVWERDSAYHQGTVWPWLMGPFVTAYLRVHGGTDAARAQVRRWLREFEAHLEEAGLGHVSEIADGDSPHTPRGCIAQAWSVAELLRAAQEAGL